MQAIDKIIRARTNLIVGQPFYGCLALHLEVIKDTYIPTMATNGKVLLYNPKFVHEIEPIELIGVVAHEVSHCSYKHMTRRGNRDPELWNVAADYRVNIDLERAGFTLPSCRLYDIKYDPYSTEEIYEIIFQEKSKSSKGKSGDDGNDGEDDSSSDSKSGMSKDKGGCGGVFDAAGPGESDKAEQMAQRWEAITRQAIGVAKAQNAGSIPSHLQKLVEALNEPRVDWRSLTRNFIDDSSRKDYSWMKPNKRYLSSGLILPGFKSDGLSHLLVFVDTSGSIWGNLKLFEEFAAEIAACLYEGIADKITVVYADTIVQKVETFETGDEVKMNPKGGGGTCFNHSMDWVIKNYPDASALIYFTDMYTMSYGADPGIPVLWACYGYPRSHQDQLEAGLPFGQLVCVDY